MKTFFEILMSDLNKKLARLFRQATNLNHNYLFKIVSLVFSNEIWVQIMYNVHIKKASIQNRSKLSNLTRQYVAGSAMRIILNSKYDISIQQRISN